MICGLKLWTQCYLRVEPILVLVFTPCYLVLARVYWGVMGIDGRPHLNRDLWFKVMNPMILEGWDNISSRFRSLASVWDILFFFLPQKKSTKTHTPFSNSPQKERAPSCEVSLILLHLLYLLDKPYHNQNASSNLTVQTRVGQNITLTCAVDAKPPAVFAWIREGAKVSVGVNSTENLSKLTFTPKKDDDFGIYWCYAGNDVGLASIRFKVNKT